MPRSPIARILLSLLILTALVGFIFGPVLKNDFVNWDDQSEITENPDFNPVSLSGLAWNWTHPRLSLYMPVTYMVWGAVAGISGRDSGGTLLPVAFHALNLALHLICCWLVFFLILQLWRRIGPALVGAMIFAVHPLQAEPVAWASGMYTLLSTAFSLGALLAYVAWVKIRTSNVERRTSNVEVNAEAGLFTSTFDVRIFLIGNGALRRGAADQSRQRLPSPRGRRDRSSDPGPASSPRDPTAVALDHSRRPHRADGQALSGCIADRCTIAVGPADRGS